MNIIDNKKAIIFDFDGTLADTLDMWDKVDEKLAIAIANDDMKQLLLNSDSWKNDISKFRTDSLRRHKNGDIYVEYSNDLAIRYWSSMNEKDVNKLRSSIASEYMKNDVCLKQGAAEFLNYLKQKGYYLVLATVGTKESLDVYIKYNKNINSVLDINNTFDLILTKNEVKKKKPDPQVYLKALELSGFNNDECLVFEDSLEGTEAAYNAFIDVANIYDKHSDHERADINELVKYSFNSFDEVLKTNIKRKTLKK